MERLTVEEKDRKFGPVFTLMVEARKAHAEYKRASSNKETSPDEPKKLEVAAEQARQAVDAALTSCKGNLDEVNQLLSYVGNVVTMDPLTPDGKGGYTYDYQRARWLTKTLMSIPADILGKEVFNPAVRRMNSLEVFIELCEATGVVPKFGMNDRALRYALDVLKTKIEQAITETGLAGKQKACELNALYGRATRAFPKSWLVAREERSQRPERPQQPQTATTSLGAVMADAAQTAAKAPVRRQNRRVR